jgi:hypothetical protein
MLVTILVNGMKFGVADPSSIDIPEGVVVKKLDFGIDQVEVSLLAPNMFALTSDEKALLTKGLKIQAIKSVRERLGLGLYESKQIVDRWAGTNGNILAPTTLAAQT